MLLAIKLYISYHSSPLDVILYMYLLNTIICVIEVLIITKGATNATRTIMRV